MPALMGRGGNYADDLNRDRVLKRKKRFCGVLIRKIELCQRVMDEHDPSEVHCVARRPVAALQHARADGGRARQNSGPAAGESHGCRNGTAKGARA